jgi:subtilisin family serine protease
MRRWLPRALVVAIALSMLLPTAAAAQSKQGLQASQAGISAIDTIDAPKSLSGRLAQTPSGLLRATSSTPINVIVKLDYDPIGSYAGGIAGLGATSPTVTGRSIRANPAAVASYRSYVARIEKRAIDAIDARIPGATTGSAFRVAYGGFALRVPANEVRDVLAIPGVAAVQRDQLEQPLAVEEPYQSIGAETVWNQLAGPVHTGEGVIVANLDTGIWPENPMLADKGLPAPPGGPYPCEFGLSGDPNDAAFACNNKVIGAKAFTDTYTTFIGAEPGEFCDKVGTDPNVTCSARDADGHGTHTLTTAAGDLVNNAAMWGADRGPTSGMAPGAHVIGYRVCLDQGCFNSDSVAAVNQAIADDVDVINFSISGGRSAYTDAVELAFLDAYAAGILVNASAGNAGPGEATADHAGAWTNTVGASYPARIYQASLHLAATNGDTLNVTGVTITPAITTPTPVVRPPAGNETCATALPVSVAGKIVLCDRGNPAGRADSGHNVLLGGGAGMILVNVGHQDLFTDLHWLPTIMLDDGTWQGVTQPGSSVRAFVTAHPSGVTATFTTGTRTAQTPDIMTTFSSRGPLGDWIKPDVTAPGIEILAGRSPHPWSGAIPSGPPGDDFMAIAGTSMSSPHAAGVSALVKAAHPTWTPGQIKSALMTSSIQQVLKPDGVTAADPFNTGAGSIRANRAIKPTLTFDVTAAQYAALASDPLHRIDANTPSINAPTMPGAVTTIRTAQNVSGAKQTFTVATTAPAGGSIAVSPSSFTLPAGRSKALTITIHGEALAPNQQYFGSITLDASSANDVYLPVAFFKRQGAVTLTHSCSPTSFAKGSSSACDVSAQNLAPADASVHVDVRSPDPSGLGIGSASATVNPDSSGTLTPDPSRGFDWDGTLSAALAPTVDSITSGGSVGGYLPLRLFGVPPIGGMGDETIVNFNVPAFLWGDETYTRVGITSDGYAVIGGGTGADVEFVPQTMPDPARPNNVIAPWWTDLDLSQAASANTGARIGTLTDGSDTWIVIDWEDVATFGTCATTCDMHSFQIWIGVSGDANPGEDVTMAHGSLGTGAGNPVNAGAENRDGSSGVNFTPTSNSDWTVNTSPPTPGGVVDITYVATGKKKGTYVVPARMTSDLTTGTTTERVTLQVT